MTRYGYEKLWLGVEQIADQISLLPDIQSGCVKSLVESMCALAFDYHNGMTNVLWSAKNNPTDCGIGDEFTVQGGRKFVTDGLKMTLLDGCHRCIAVR